MILFNGLEQKLIYEKAAIYSICIWKIFLFDIWIRLIINICKTFWH